METTDRVAVRAIAVARRRDVAKVVEGQEVRDVIVRRSRPTVAEVADIAQTAVEVVARTRSRIPDTGEIHASVGAIVGSCVRR